MWASHTAEAYSKCGLTKAWWACVFTVWDDNLRFLRHIPSVLFALLVMLLICLLHFKSLEIVIPRYFVESVIGKGWSWMVYVLRIVCLVRPACMV